MYSIEDKDDYINQSIKHFERLILNNIIEEYDNKIIEQLKKLNLKNTTNVRKKLDELQKERDSNKCFKCENREDSCKCGF
jgi:hypothetical protein